MGSNWARVIAGSGHDLSAIVDVEESRARALGDQFDAPASSDVEDALRCDALIVATSTEAHEELALAAIAAGRPTLVEKPLSLSVDSVRRVVKAAGDAGIPLMCGFVERFNPAVTTVRTLIDQPVLHGVALRHSPPDPRMKGSIAHDLLIHDIDLMMSFAGGASIHAAQSVRLPHPTSGRDEVCDCTLQFSSGMVATLSSSRIGQSKIRQLHLVTLDALYELDLLRVDVTIYRNIREKLEDGNYRAQTIIDVPFVRHAGEPLEVEFEHFCRLVSGEGDVQAELEAILPPHQVADAASGSHDASGPTTARRPT